MTTRTRLLPGRLNTTLHPSALPAGASSRVFNCSTARGILEKDKRYRRVQVPPEATITGEACTGLLAPDSVSSQSRTGSTVAWSDPENAIPPDGVYASAELSVGDKTEMLKAAEFASSGIPAGGTLTRLRIQVLARAVAGEDDLPVDVVDDLVRLTLDGNPVGPNAATLTPLTSTAAVREYAINPVTASITADMILAGRVGAVVGYRTNPETNVFSSGWTLAYLYDGDSTETTPAGSSTTPWEQTPAGGERQAQAVQDTPGGASASASGLVSVSANRAVDEPDYVVIEITSRAKGDWESGSPANCGASVDNDIAPQATASGLVGEIEVEDAKRFRLDPGANQTLAVTALTTATDVPESTLTSTIQVTGAVVEPDPATVEVDSIQLIACFETEVETTTTPQGIGLGRFAGASDVAAVIGGGAFDVASGETQGAMGNDWRDERSGSQREAGAWCIWQFGKWLFYSHPIDGVYRRSIGADDWEPIYKDSESPGSTGDAVATVVRPPYDVLEFDAGVDTLAIIGTGGGGLSIHEEAIKPDGKVWMRTNDAVTGSYVKSWIEFEMTFGEAKVLDDPMALAVVMEQGAYDDAVWLAPGNDGFNDRASDNHLILTGGGDSVTVAPVVRGKLNQKEGTYCAWFDISGVASEILASLEKIQLRFGIYQTGRAEYRLTSFVVGGTRYHDLAGDFKDALETNTEEMEYAYDYSEGSSLRLAKELVIPAKTHLGARVFASTPVVPYLGSVQSIRVPTADSPYTSAATINLYRKVGNVYQRIATGPNTEDLVFEDRLPDSKVAGDTATYPITILDFSDASPSLSGIATGVTCGCAWKGSNVYAVGDGTVCFSKTGDPTAVLWDNVVLTNDVGSDDLGPPRTSTVADDTTSPVIALVPTENLYCFTRTECYVFVSGETAATASFPRKVDGVRGVLGPRAACQFGDRALVGCDDGLWAVKKGTTYGEQPDELIEVSKDVRGSWEWLLSESPTTVVVRHLLGEIWCFNGARYLHFTRDRLTIEGEWADERTVFDAVADPEYGLVLLLGDGHLGLIADCKTDGGANLAGDDGTPFSWEWVSPQAEASLDVKRAVVSAESDALPAEISVEADFLGGVSAVNVEESGVVSFPFERLPGDGRMGGGRGAFSVRGGATDRVLALWVDVVTRDVPRAG